LGFLGNLLGGVGGREHTWVNANIDPDYEVMAIQKCAEKNQKMPRHLKGGICNPIVLRATKDNSSPLLN
jgi:hypothetical protein